MIAYYISAHGFGHAARAAEVIRALPWDVPVLVRTGVPQWFLRQATAGRPFDYEPAVFDSGVIGPDSSRTDVAATVEHTERVLEDNVERFHPEVDLLRHRAARLVVTDIVPFATAVARAAGVPSVVIANFLWTNIYAHLRDHYTPCTAFRRRLDRIIDHMQAEYDQGDLLLTPDMAVPMRACGHQQATPLIARHGRPRRRMLAEGLGLDPNRPIYLLYLGRNSIEGMHWQNIDRLAGLQLVGYAVPPGAETLVHHLPDRLMDHADAAASVDAVVAKPGYGICSECVAARTPLFYPPRPDFVEIRAIGDLMRRWGGGACMPAEDFLHLNWRPYLQRAERLRRTMRPIECSGALACARHILSLYPVQRFQ